MQRISLLAGRAVLITAPLSIGSILRGAVPFVAATIVGGLVLRKKVRLAFGRSGYSPAIRYIMATHNAR